MEIKRDLYLSKLIQSRDNGLVKVVTGVTSFWQIISFKDSFQKLFIVRRCEYRPHTNCRFRKYT